MSEDLSGERTRTGAPFDESAALKRGADRDEGAVEATPPANIGEVVALGEHVHPLTRELYYLLPEHLRPSNPASTRKLAPSATYKPPEKQHNLLKPGGSKPRGVRRPDWTIDAILALADRFYEQKGHWPHNRSGRLGAARGDTWNAVDQALRRGYRGLPGGLSLATLLYERRKARGRSFGRPLYIEEILQWAREHYARTGAWPKVHSGPITGTHGETWSAVNNALYSGARNLPGGSSLTCLIAEHLGGPNRYGQPDLTEEQVLAWADAHYARTGKWPNRTCEDVLDAPGENWGRIDKALVRGSRALTAGSSLARLLAMHRGTRNPSALPDFDPETICRWADLHFQRTGSWPTVWSGAIVDAPGETWRAVDRACMRGSRGLSGSGYRSLARLLRERRGRLGERRSRSVATSPVDE